WYRPLTGSWTSQGPDRLAGGTSNLCQYVGNNPMGATDPSGWHIEKLDFSPTIKGRKQRDDYTKQAKQADTDLAQRVGDVLSVLRTRDLKWARTVGIKGVARAGWPADPKVDALYTEMHREIISRVERLQKEIKKGYRVFVHHDDDKVDGARMG